MKSTRLFQSIRDNLFIFIIYLLILCVISVPGIALLKGPIIAKLLGSMILVFVIWLFLKFPDFYKFLKKKENV